MTTEMLLVWLPSLLISLLSILVFVYLGYRNRQKIDRLTQQAHDYSLQRIEDFLQREAQVTRQRIKSSLTTPGAPTHSIDKLRLTWLEAELTALVDQGKRRSNYDLLLHGVQPIARLINRPPTKSTAVEQIQKARTTLTSQNEIIRQYRKKITSVAVEPEQAQSTAAFGTTLGNVEQNSGALIATITRLENELAALQSKLDTTEQHTRNSSEPDAKSTASEFFLVSTTAAHANAANATRNLLDETEQIYRQSVAEMNRMREINSQQRALILQLDQELALVRRDSAQYDLSSDVLDKLKLQLRDYETCTVILEKEADTLRDKIDSLKKIIAHQSEPASSEDPPAAIAPAHIEIPHSSQPFDTLRLLGEITAATSMQALVAKLIEWLRQQKLSAVVFVRGTPEQLWASSEGGVDSHSKQLMQSIAVLPNKPRLDIDEGTLFVYPICRVLIYQNSLLGDKHSEQLQRLQLTIKIIDGWLALLQERQLAHGGTDLQSVQDQLSGLLAQYSYVIKENRRIGEEFRDELNKFFANTGMSAVQQQVVKTMLEEFDAQLEVIGKASKLIYTRLKALTQDIEQREALH